MGAKKGKSLPTISPAAPTKGEAADKADPGEIAKAKAAQKEAGSGKYGKTPAIPHKRDQGDSSSAADNGKDDASDDDVLDSWIEIELIDQGGNPYPGEAYEILLPNGSLATGTLDENGFAREEGFFAGDCIVSFPNLDKDLWK